MWTLLIIAGIVVYIGLHLRKNLEGGGRERTRCLRLAQDVEKLKVLEILLKADDIKTD